MIYHRTNTHRAWDSFAWECPAKDGGAILREILTNNNTHYFFHSLNDVLILDDVRARVCVCVCVCVSAKLAFLFIACIRMF